MQDSADRHRKATVPTPRCPNWRSGLSRLAIMGSVLTGVVLFEGKIFA